MDCVHCGGRIHFGPAVAALRDEDNRALGGDECAVVRLAPHQHVSAAAGPVPELFIDFECDAVRTASEALVATTRAEGGRGSCLPRDVITFSVDRGDVSLHVSCSDRNLT